MRSLCSYKAMALCKLKGPRLKSRSSATHTFMVMLALICTGCSTYSPLGNHFTELEVQRQYQLATEAVNQVVSLYPPAKVRIELIQPTSDEFGKALLDNLRESGYAVQEYPADKASSDQPNSQPGLVSKPAGFADETASLRLGYVLDQASGLPLYRMTLLLNQQSLSRPYWSEQGNLKPAGYWLRKE